jgi:hypothetical protein
VSISPSTNGAPVRLDVGDPLAAAPPVVVAEPLDPLELHAAHKSATAESTGVHLRIVISLL